MARHAEEAKLIAEAFELLADACYNIKDYDLCDECPMRYMCLDDTEESVITMAELKSTSSWREFLEYSRKADFLKEDRDAAHADFMRDYIKEEDFMRDYIKEERWIDENDG